jgi:NUMOD4 motif
MDETTDERWMPVVGHPGYEVSDQGRVRSVDRIVPFKNGHSQRCRGRLLEIPDFDPLADRYYAELLAGRNDAA